jgi:flagellar biosynthetic protein FlhB
MAEDDNSQKTEDPTPKRQAEAREKGQIAKSREVEHWVVLLAITLAVFIFGPSMAADLKRAFIMFLEAPHAIAADKNALPGLLTHLLTNVGLKLAPIVGIIMAAGIGAGLIQHGVLFAPDLIKPKFSKLSPAAGFKRLFSVAAMVEFVKGAFKILLVSAFLFWLMRADFNGLEKYIFVDENVVLQFVLRLTLKLLAGVLGMMALIAILDYGFQRYKIWRDLRMSREEIREEHKQSEGDPMVKGRLRQLRMERARRRMMQEVPKADVIVTNPTHYAVALKYDQAKMAAPKLVAKGADLVAQKIRDLAIEHNIPILQNPPLARSLFANVDLDREIPPEHYKAVAEIIGYVYKLRRGEHAIPPYVPAEVEARPN